MYITCCLIKIFTLATNTYEEQHRHIAALQMMSASLVLRYGNLVDSPLNNVSSSLPPPPHPGSSNNPMAVSHPMNNRYNPNFVNSNGSMDEYDGDGPLYMDSPISKHHYSSYHTRFPSDGHFDPLIHGQRNFGIAMQPASRSRDEEDDDLRDYDMKSLDEMDSAMPAISSNSPKGKTQKDTFFLEDFPPIETSSFMLQHSNSNANISSVNNNNLNHTATSNNMPPAITATNSKPGVIDNLLKKSFFGNPSEVANNTDIEGLPIDDERPPSRPLSRSGSHNLLRSRSKSNQENESECREDLESNLHPTSDETAPLLEVPKVESSCRMTSVNVENFRQTIAELISQIRYGIALQCLQIFHF